MCHIDARDYLLGYRKSKAISDGIERELETLWDDYKSPGFDRVPGPIGQPSAPVIDLTEKRAQLRQKLIDTQCMMMDQMAEIMDTILCLSDSVEVKVLMMRYIEGRRWDDIADDIAYSRAQALRYHDQAIDHVQEMLDRSGQHETK